jgi:hypothetical protein
LGALVSAEVKNETAQRPTKRRVRVEHDLLIEVRVETRVPRVEVRCGMDFIAHKNDVPVRLELGKPVKFKRRGTYVLTARADPGTLQPSTVYEIRADATISHSSEPDPIVLVREAGRISVVGDPDHGEAATETVPHWSGGTAARVESEWSVQ